MGKWLLFALCGAISGILGGMGMGGGTLLIPMLTIFFGVGQHEAQAINLVSFIPMAALALFIHAKNGRVKKEGLWLLILPAVALSVGGSFLAAAAPAGILKKIFGGFLVALGVFQFFSSRFSGADGERSGKGTGKDGKEEKEGSSSTS